MPKPILSVSHCEHWAVGKLGKSLEVWEEEAMLLSLSTLFSSLLLAAVSPNTSPQWKTAFPVELPKQQCQGNFCISQFNQGETAHTILFETEESKLPFSKRELLHVVDTSRACEGAQLNVGRFFQFEKRDVDGDGTLDTIVLIQAGKTKRKPTAEEPCPHPHIGTAIYEVAYLTRPGASILNPPSELVVRRLGSLNALANTPH